METIKIKIKGLNYCFSIYLYKKIVALKKSVQVMKNTADHFQQIIKQLNIQKIELERIIEKMKSSNLNSRKRRRNMIMFNKKKHYYVGN